MKMTPANRNIILALIPSVLAFVYFFPRFLIKTLGVDNPWTSYLYQYTFGLVFFGLGVVMMLRTGACVPGRGRDTLWLQITIGGFVFFASLHAIWIFLALHMPYKGGL